MLKQLDLYSKPTHCGSDSNLIHPHLHINFKDKQNCRPKRLYQMYHFCLLCKMAWFFSVWEPKDFTLQPFIISHTSFICFVFHPSFLLLIFPHSHQADHFYWPMFPVFTFQCFTFLLPCYLVQHFPVISHTLTHSSLSLSLPLSVSLGLSGCSGIQTNAAVFCWSACGVIVCHLMVCC